MTFITHDGQKITAVYSGDPTKLNIETVIVPDTFQGRKGMALGMLDDEWKIRPMAELIEEGYVEKPQGMVWDDINGDWRLATEAELVADGRRELGEREKIEGDIVVPKTMEELDSEGLLTSEERKAWLREEAHQQLEELDRQSIRAIRAVIAGTDTQADRDRLTALENEAQEKRQNLRD